MGLRTQVQQLRKGVYYTDHLRYLFEGLPAGYNPFVTAVYNRLNQPSLEDVQTFF